MKAQTAIVFALVAVAVAGIVAYVYVKTRPGPSRSPFESILHELAPYAPALAGAL